MAWALPAEIPEKGSGPLLLSASLDEWQNRTNMLEPRNRLPTSGCCRVFLGTASGKLRFLVFSLWILTSLLSSPRVFADRWYVHYENAERALEAQEWSTAVSEIQEALERKGDSGSRVRSYGMRVVDYFPYLKLGIAYHHLGQPAAAKEAFDTEERLGAIADVQEALAQLQRYRLLAEEAEDEARRSAVERTEEALRQSLAAARRLEAQGDPDAAMEALASGLALDPENPEANRLMETLRSRAVAEEETRRRAEDTRQKLGSARELLEEGEAESAAGLLRQILVSGDNEEARQLLRQAQGALAEVVAEDQRQASIESSLAEARRLFRAGSLEDALARLERISALDADHPAANRLRVEILEVQQDARAKSLLTDTLEAAEREFRAGRFEVALSGANRALALEQGHPEAIDLVRRAYRQISQRLLGAPAEENLPPAIRFADRRQDVEGERVEPVRRREFRLSGVVIDRSPVTVEILDHRDRPLEARLEAQQVGETYITEFRLEGTLTPGPSSFTVVATDADGASSRGEYRVEFQRPWFRSPWLWVAAAAVLVLGLLGGLFKRRRKRRALLRRRFNPYIAGRPIFDPDLFFGREPLVQKILQTVHNNSLLLYGERRIGKTSLLHQLHRRLEALEDPEFDFLPVYIDLQGTPEEKFFATLADQIFDTLDPETPREPARSRPEGYSHHDLVRELHGLLKTLRGTTTKKLKVVLLIDEVDELNHYDPRVNQSLRSLFMKRFAENLAAVVAGVGIRKEWEKEGSPWYNFFEEVEVRAISPDEAQRLVVEPVREIFRFEEGAAERIVASSEGKPFLIQRRCLALVGLLHEEGRRTITVADVDALEAPDESPTFFRKRAS